MLRLNGFALFAVVHSPHPSLFRPVESELPRTDALLFHGLFAVEGWHGIAWRAQRPSPPAAHKAEQDRLFIPAPPPFWR